MVFCSSLASLLSVGSGHCCPELSVVLSVFGFLARRVLPDIDLLNYMYTHARASVNNLLKGVLA